MYTHTYTHVHTHTHTHTHTRGGVYTIVSDSLGNRGSGFLSTLYGDLGFRV